MSSAKRTLSLRIKLLSLPLLFLLGLVVQQAANLHIQGLLEENVVAPRFRETALDGHRELLKAAVQIETQTLALKLKDCPTREEQIAVIIRETDPVRFLDDQSGYFFTYDLQGTRVNVPINKADNGRNLIDLKDADGVFLIRELIAVARAGGGFVTYRFEKAGAGIQPKLSYAALIPGTDFFVGSGVYIDDVEADLALLATDLNAASARLLRWALILSAIVLVFTLAAAIRVSESTTRSIRAVISDLDTGGSQISAAAAHISDSSQMLARGASDQAAALEETGASLAEMSALATHNTRDATTASELARAARLSADHGTDELDAMSRAMSGIKDASDDVAKIIKTIDEIAFQTNILALNAAVEAARAGESGAGFAIVAEEVRALAQRSALAARETAGKIEGAIAKTAQGVDITRQVTTRLDEIATKVRQVDDLVGKVASDSRSQSERVQQITAASGSVDRVVQANAASAEENAAAAEELTAQANALGAAISHLRVLVSGRRRQSPIATPARGNPA